MTFPIWFAAQHPQIPLAGAQAILALPRAARPCRSSRAIARSRPATWTRWRSGRCSTRKERWDEIIKRQAFIVEEIERQGKLTPELEARSAATFDATLLEDIYLPYKQKRKTKAEIAREAGLEPLADWLWDCGHGDGDAAPGETPEARAAGVRRRGEGRRRRGGRAGGRAATSSIERLSEDAALRQRVRTRAASSAGCARTRKGEKAKTPSRFENYFAYQEPVRSCSSRASSHRYLAMRRGWMEEELVLSLGGRAAATTAPPIR